MALPRRGGDAVIVVDPTAPLPPSEQIRVQVADLIHSGALPGGHRLPSIRQLASDLRVAPGTVARAYSDLESEGLVETNRAAGTRVRHGVTHPESVRAASERFVRGLAVESLEEALAAVRAAWSQVRAPRALPPSSTGHDGDRVA